MKKIRKTVLIVLLFMAVVGAAVHWAFYDIQRLVGQEVLAEVLSPDGSSVITAYLTNGGATTDFGVLCEVRNTNDERKRNFYWQYHCSEAVVRWIDNETAEVNGVAVDVWEDTYDYRHE